MGLKIETFLCENSRKPGVLLGRFDSDLCKPPFLIFTLFISFGRTQIPNNSRYSHQTSVSQNKYWFWITQFPAYLTINSIFVYICSPIFAESVEVTEVCNDLRR